MHAFYIRKKYLTIAAVLEKAREECGFLRGRFYLWRVLKGIGFTYKKQNNKNTYTNTQAYWNKDILVDYTQTEKTHTNLVYTDETWVNTHHNNKYTWVDSDGSGGWKVPSRGHDTYNYTRQRQDSENEDLIDGDDRQIIDSTGTVNRDRPPEHIDMHKPKTRLNRDHPTVGSQPCHTTFSLNHTVQNQPGSHYPRYSW